MKKRLLTTTMVLLMAVLLPGHILAQFPVGDWGDAPEGAPAYLAPMVLGSFPTCMNVPIAGFIYHNNFGAWFGPAFDFEIEGNAGLCPTFGPYDADECFFMDGDAGLLFPQAYTIDQTPAVVPCPTGQAQPALGLTCQTAVWGPNVDIDVTNIMPGGTPGWVNVIMDWNQDGIWGGSSSCPPTGIPAPEHVLVNFFSVPNGFSGPLSALFPPPFLIGPNPGYVWTRFTITEQPVPLPWDGSGFFEDGESEDYLLLVDPVDDPTIFPVVETECPEIQTECPVIDTECPVIDTECPAMETECPVVDTRCPVDPTFCPVIETECPAEPTICSQMQTECPDPTLCPPVETHCPSDPTFCPIIDTQCPVDPVATICPEIATECPEIFTECPVAPTFCPEYFTFCPEDPTFCPIFFTECPMDPTFCPTAPTVCELTICDVIPTWCPDDIPTECPVDPTFCPDVPTVCPDIQTECPEVITLCPVTPTLCETPVQTLCPTDPTNCPSVTTECPVNPTTCPSGPTFCVTVDTDGDGVDDCNDNCPNHPNGPLGGTCTSGNVGDLCTTNGDCGTGGFCSLAQEDTYPPGGNGCGDACECEGNFENDDDQDGTDAAKFKVDFGRNGYNNPCSGVAPCNGDFDCDVDVDGTDAAVFKEDFGRNQYNNPCPSCPTDPWCAYP